MTEILRDFKFYVDDHDKIEETINAVVENNECHFCQAQPIAIVYQGWGGKIVAACKEHEEIVLEMVEQAKQ
jgi:hypothetical protein